MVGAFALVTPSPTSFAYDLYNLPQVDVSNIDTCTVIAMGPTPKNSTANTPVLARAQPSNGHLNGLGKVVPTSNGIVALQAGHDNVHSANTSTPSSPAGSISSSVESKELKFFDHMNGSTPASTGCSPDKVTKDKSEKKNKSRITRIFSQSSRDKEKREKEKELEQQRKKQAMNGSGDLPHSGATNPMPRHSEKDGDVSSDTDGARSRGSSVAGDHPSKLKNVSGGPACATNFVRFKMLEDGVNHVHHLRAAKRQEKLSTLLQSWLGGGQKKKGDDDRLVPPRDPLSLMSSWMDQWKAEKAAVKKDGSGPSSPTLVEKYGRCQEVIGRGIFIH